MAGKDLSNKVTFDKRPEGNGRESHVDIWGKSISGRRNGKFQGLKVGTYPEFNEQERGANMKRGESTRC